MPKTRVDTLTDKFFDTIWAKPTGQIPETVYHYTNAPGLVGMLTSRKVWATDCRCLNDETESALGNLKAREFIRGKSIKSEEDRIRQFYRTLQFYLSKPDEDPNFIFSLSSRRDDLSQWRAYANEGRGYTIGFKTKSLLEHGKADTGPYGFSRVSYNSTKQDQQISTIISDFEQEVLRSRLIDNALNDLIDQAALAADWVISSQSVLSKHSSFMGEREWRINTYAGGNEKVKVRASGDRLVPYIELALCGDDENCLPIISVGIGPGFKDRAARYAVEKLLSETGFEAEIYYAIHHFEACNEVIPVTL